MVPGLSMQLVWPLAAQEAIAADYKRIELFHLLIAVLKFAELDDSQIEAAVLDQAVLAPLFSERNELRSLLESQSITVPRKTREIRHALRRQSGKGGHPYDGQRIMHRSEASRNACREAESLARKNGSNAWTVCHLLAALLKRPPMELNKMSGKLGNTKEMQSKPTPCLDRYGRDLTANAREQVKGGASNIIRVVEGDPVSKVVISDVLGEENSNVLLIKKGERSPKEIVATIAAYFIGENAPEGAGNQRIVELDIPTDGSDALDIVENEVEEKMASVLEEIVQSGNLVIFLNKIERFLKIDKDGRIGVLLKTMLSNENVRFIAGIDEQNYFTYVEKDREWAKLLRPVWIHDLNALKQL